jgi:hypothetical protein
MIQLRDQRKEEEGKETTFRKRGRLVEDQVLSRFERHNKGKSKVGLTENSEESNVTGKALQ